MSGATYLAFAAVAAGLAAVPGPTIAVIIASTLREGPRAGALNILGAQLGISVWLALAGLGLSSALHWLGPWFDVLRYAAAACLVWLALRLLAANGGMAAAAKSARPGQGLVLQGFVVTLTNPKMVMMFAMLIPSFLDGTADVAAQSLILGAIFAVLAALSDLAYLAAVARARYWLARGRVRVIERVSGAVLLVGATWMALQGRV